MIGFAIIDGNAVLEYAQKTPAWVQDHYDYFYARQSRIRLHGQEEGRVKDPVGDKKDRAFLFRLVAHLEETGQKMEAYCADDFAAVIGYNGIRFVLPAEAVTIEPLKDYSGMTCLEMQGTGGCGSLPMTPAITDSPSAAAKKKEKVEEELKKLESEMKDVRDGTAGALSEAKAKLDAAMAEMKRQQDALMAGLLKQQEAFAEEKRKLEKELFILETQIYGIRCYLGEAVAFYTVRGGEPAPEELPIVIYQKVRFLDEELGRHLSLYGYGDRDGDREQLLTALKHRDDIAEVLCPGPKSISAVKISRTGTIKRASRQAANMLKDYRLYHENQLAILIRNGEQIHIAWLDARRINISEDVFYRPGMNEAVPPGEGMDGHGAGIDKGSEAMEFISRWFFFSVLQGVLDNTALISIPEKVKITDMDSPYLCYSLAEGWIATDRYGSFSEMLGKSAHIPLKEGDYVLTGTMITRDDKYQDRFGRWNNNRGIGERNRTCGAAIPGMEAVRVNKVISGIHVKYRVRVCRANVIRDPEGMPMYKYTNPDGSWYSQSYPDPERDDAEVTCKPAYKADLTDDEIRTEEYECDIEGDVWYDCVHGPYRRLTDRHLRLLSGIKEGEVRKSEETISKYGWFNDIEKAYSYQESGGMLCHIKIMEAKIIGENNYQYYASARKEYSVNLRFYPEEVIPLPFLCASWVKSVIMNGSIGSFTLCGAIMDYADMLPYLSRILGHLQEREKKEKEMLMGAGGGSWLAGHEDWDAVLCEWKINNQIHALTRTGAKRFLKERTAVMEGTAG